MIRRRSFEPAASRIPRARSLGLAAVLAVVALLMSLVAVGPASAQNSECNPLDRGGTRCRIGDGGGGAPEPGGRTISTRSPPGPRFVWLNLLLSCDAATSSGWTPLTDLDSAIFDLSILPGIGDPAEPGVLWIGELIDPITGGTNTGYLSCVGDGEALPALPPPLPTAGEIWGAALTFDPAVNLDPYVRGLTGLETFMWYEGPTSDSLTLTLNGYGVQADIVAAEFRWDMGADSRTGDRAYISSIPGSADGPAAEHTYAQPEDVVVVHETLWTGSAVLTGPGLPPGGVVVDLGEAVLATARAYSVIEVRTPVVRGQSG